MISIKEGVEVSILTILARLPAPMADIGCMLIQPFQLHWGCIRELDPLAATLAFSLKCRPLRSHWNSCGETQPEYLPPDGGGRSAWRRSLSSLELGNHGEKLLDNQTPRSGCPVSICPLRWRQGRLVILCLLGTRHSTRQHGLEIVRSRGGGRRWEGGAEWAGGGSRWGGGTTWSDRRHEVKV